MQKKVIIGVVILTVLAVGALIILKTQKKPAAMQMPTVEVGIIVLEPQKMPLENEFAGRVKASLQSEVRPRVNGIIRERLFNEGDFVKEDQVLYKIDGASYKAAYNQAAAALKSAQANIEAAKLKAQRYADLLAHNGVSRQDYDDAQASYMQALAMVEERAAAAETAKIDVERTEIKAPISGYIGISSFTPGALVTANQTAPLAIIRVLDPVYVDMIQSSSQILRRRLMPENASITKESKVHVKLKFEDGQIYKEDGDLQLQEVAIDEATGTVTMRAVFPNPQGLLLPGMYVKTIVNGSYVNDAILVKQQAVTFNAKGEGSVFIVNQDNKIEQRSIKVGAARDDKWSITEGLGAGERVVVEGTNKVRAGQLVKPVELK